MNQGGVKHAAAEPTRIDNKRERRRGAAGRAAALRRAPSDSDCSGETASLSADSGDRVLRPAPQPPRSGKSRSRRRGSEWEVLEGLKDGQRFEKRPDVFNGYLHKKRKWPLKGWHKRFFVVDGGILVYARSPADVARGRLHGSVDVGLSVISAKARRRRIDIDADEFIYHLRAKTPDVFRTWLSVLKAHRLYRQHLLTFGAREAVPKINAPLDDLPQTDTSSRLSETSSEISTLSSSEDHAKPGYLSQNPCPIQSKIENWHSNSISKRELIPLKFGSLDENNIFDVKYNDTLFNKSLCSMNCARMVRDLQRKTTQNVSQGSADGEKQIHSTDLDLNSLRSTEPFANSSPMCDISLNSENVNDSTIKTVEILSESNKNLTSSQSNEHTKDIRSIYTESKAKPTTAYFFFTRKKNYSETIDSPMKRSKKSTNLVKYKNIMDEPTLARPLSKCMLLDKYKLKMSKQVDTEKSKNRAVACDTTPKENNEVQVQIKDKEHKASQDIMTASEYDRITERLMVSILEAHSSSGNDTEVKYYINQVIKDLYDVRFSHHVNPVKALFRNLLEYWLKNTAITNFKEAMTRVKSIDTQSNQYFTKDEKLSSVVIRKVSKETQFYGVNNIIVRHKADKGNHTNKHLNKNKNDNRDPLVSQCKSPKRDTESFEKERRIQELEKLLKNTVYICETRRDQSRNKDIQITKTLIDNLGKLSLKPKMNKSTDIDNNNSNSSTELPKIQDTINHLISETSVPPDVAKEFLSAYLDVLLHESSKSDTNTSSQSSDDLQKINMACDVQAESVIKKLSKSITTFKQPIIKNVDEFLKENINPIDPGQLYLKDVLDKITTIFSKSKNVDNNWQNIANKDIKTTNNKVNMKDELGKSVKEYPGKKFIHENCDEKSIVIDLSKYDLEHISMFSDPAIERMMSITIKLKEKPPNFGESKRKHLNLRFSDAPKLQEAKTDNWLPFISHSDTFDNIFSKVPLDTVNKNPFIDAVSKDFIDLKPYISNSDATSKAYRVIHESEHSIDISFRSRDLVHNDINKNDDPQSCFLMSSLKKSALVTKFNSKKKVRLKESNGIILSPENNILNRLPTRNTHQQLSVFENTTPRIIDEKFIILLLENLTLLSKGIPSLHKDINNVYVKLKKKYEKVAKNCTNVQGLSLLGKIYNDEPCRSDGNETQFEGNICPEINEIVKESLNTATNTSFNKYRNTVIDLPITDINVEKGKTNIVVQTDTSKEIKPYADENKALTFKSRNLIASFSCEETQTVERATSNPNWLKRTRECAVSTVIKYILDSDSTENFRISQAARPIKLDWNILKKCKKQLSKNRQDLIKDITLLSPTLKVSTQSQTVRKLIRFTKDDFEVYPLYLSNKYVHTRSSSMTDCNAEITKSDELKTLYRCASDPSYCSESGGPLENTSRELGQAQLSVQQLQRLLDALELQQQVHHDTDVSIEGASPSVKKDRRKFGLRKKKSNSKCSSVELAPPHIDPSSSHTALSALTAPPSPGGGASSAPNSAASLPIACAAARPQSLPGAEALGPAAGPASLSSLTPDHQLREDFTVLAKDLLASLKTIVATLVCERGRLRAAMEAADTASTPGGSVMTALRTNLTSALQQNSELRSRLSRIHLASDLAEISSAAASADPQANRQFQQSLSYSSSCVSASEFFDAEEHEDDLKPEEVIAADEAGVIELDGDSSSEAGSLSSEEGSASSDNSDGAMLSAEQETLRLNTNGTDLIPATGWSRRTRLPSPRPTPGGPSLWNLLYKNIGKDLSQISMPVTINEPLNMLQRLCEELEYCSLLDSAAACASGVERMALVAAFAVSAYAAAAHRAASKPFNPLLAETYECVRIDRGFRFLAEQVSHHPPISACHAESERWCFWQEARIKTKFWGKSMEFQPTGRVHVRLNSTGDHYSWNKVTTCVHNLFGGQRWVDQYGDMHIVCHGTDISCKLNFVKASSWSSSRHEVRGAVSAGGGGGRLRLAGRWSEALYAGEPPHSVTRCLWRPDAMPPDHDLYYGFTRFAMELNELEPGMRDVLPHTDTRLRPDQRALEEGDVEAAEQFKHELEQAQRERRRDSPEHSPAWFRKTLESGEETWVFSGEYWKAREAGFPDNIAPRIW